MGLRHAGPDGSDVAPVAASTTRKWSGVPETTAESASVGQPVLAHEASNNDAETAMLKFFMSSPWLSILPCVLAFE
jgi:hypothetical protein